MTAALTVNNVTKIQAKMACVCVLCMIVSSRFFTSGSDGMRRFSQKCLFVCGEVNDE